MLQNLFLRPFSLAFMLSLIQLTYRLFKLIKKLILLLLIVFQHQFQIYTLLLKLDKPSCYFLPTLINPLEINIQIIYLLLPRIEYF